MSGSVKELPFNLPLNIRWNCVTINGAARRFTAVGDETILQQHGRQHELNDII